jgi:glycogen operon protein
VTARRPGTPRIEAHVNVFTRTGRPYPLGATVTSEGINFAVFSRNARRVWLELFASVDDGRPRHRFELDPARNRTGDVWHLFVTGVGDGQLYGFRVDGPYAPVEAGHRFNANKLLLDPYARAIAGEYAFANDSLYGYDRSSPLRDLSFSTADSAPYTAKSMALAPSKFDWEGDRPPRRSLNDSVIYEVHVKGFTIHPSSAATHPGTYLGVVERIPHLLELGVTAVELLPVHEFAEGEPIGIDPVTGQVLRNYWGYQSLGFFAPEQSYAWDRRPGAPIEEFQQMVRQLHRAGLEVILDVVFNHTGEGNELGPTICFRGLDNASYYMLEGGRHYKNFSGCGNTLNCNLPVLKQLILDSLRYWVVEMHVDGFRFDLATILGRSSEGKWIGDLSLLYDIGGDPVLRGCKLIAEAWDAEGMYKVGGFPAGWAEWNGRFRDDVRRFVRGDGGMVPELARRLGGSRDLFASKANPAHSINFITAHDGFTLRDLCSYKEKHNERNGENNQDGSAENFSANWGVEVEPDDPRIRRLRMQQAKNFLAILLTARGTPMLLGGDENWRTQQGNNNAYCQDNELGWLAWTPSPEADEIHRFLQRLVALRRRHPAFRRPCFVDPFAVDGAGVAGQVGSDITWHGVRQHQPDWAYWSHSLAMHIHGAAPVTAPGTDDQDFFIAISSWTKALDFELPHLPVPLHWYRLVETSRLPPEDILLEEEAPRVAGRSYRLEPHSTVVLMAR